MWLLHTGIERAKEIIEMKQKLSNKHCTQLSNRAALYRQS